MQEVTFITYKQALTWLIGLLSMMTVIAGTGTGAYIALNNRVTMNEADTKNGQKQLSELKTTTGLILQNVQNIDKRLIEREVREQVMKELNQKEQ